MILAMETQHTAKTTNKTKEAVNKLRKEVEEILGNAYEVKISIKAKKFNVQFDRYSRRNATAKLLLST